MARGEDTSQHPSRRVDRDSVAPLITEHVTPGGDRLRQIGSYTSYVQSPEGGYKAAPKDWRSNRGDYGLSDYKEGRS